MYEMYREIKKRKVILENRQPFEPDVVKYINEYNLLDCIHSSLRLDGSAITKEATTKIMKGEFVVEATLGDHVLIEHYKNAFKLAYDMIEMSFNLDLKCLMKFYHILSDDDALKYRRSNPILIQYKYNPPHPQEIEEQMGILMKWVYKKNVDQNPIERAVMLHNRIIEIYPYEKFSESVARMAMNYMLLSEGFPPVGISMKESEYNDAISLYLKKEDIQPIYSSVERAIYNKLEIFLQLTSIN